jgi:4-hydroxy-3-polyprenylbenzoate decarboxylase
MGYPMRLIVGLSGASGILYGIRMLEVLRELGIESDLIMTDMAGMMIELETSWKEDDVAALATRRHDCFNFTSALASGGYRSLGMVVLPCSMKQLLGSPVVSQITCSFVLRTVPSKNEDLS